MDLPAAVALDHGVADVEHEIGPPEVDDGAILVPELEDGVVVDHGDVAEIECFRRLETEVLDELPCVVSGDPDPLSADHTCSAVGVEVDEGAGVDDLAGGVVDVHV